MYGVVSPSAVDVQMGVVILENLHSNTAETIMNCFSVVLTQKNQGPHQIQVSDAGDKVILNEMY